MSKKIKIIAIILAVIFTSQDITSTHLPASLSGPPRLSGAFPSSVLRPQAAIEKRKMALTRPYAPEDYDEATGEAPDIEREVVNLYAMVDRKASAAELAARREAAALQDREDVLEFFEDYIENTKDPLSLRTPVEIEDMHPQLKKFLRYSSGFRIEKFRQALHNIFGRGYFVSKTEQERTTFATFDLLWHFLDHYTEELREASRAEETDLLDRPVGIEVLYRGFRRFYNYRFSREAFFKLLQAVFGLGYFSDGNEERTTVKLSDLPAYKTRASAPEALIRVDPQTNIMLELIKRVKEERAILFGQEESVRQILLSLTEDKSGENDKKAVRELSACLKPPHNMKLAGEMVREAREALGGEKPLPYPTLTLPEILAAEIGPLAGKTLIGVELNAGRGDFLGELEVRLRSKDCSPSLWGVETDRNLAQEGLTRGRHIVAFDIIENGRNGGRDKLEDMKGMAHMVTMYLADANNYEAFIKYSMGLLSKEGLFFIQPAQGDRERAEVLIRSALSIIPEESGFMVFRIAEGRCVGSFNSATAEGAEVYVIKKGDSPFKIVGRRKLRPLSAVGKTFRVKGTKSGPPAPVRPPALPEHKETALSSILRQRALAERAAGESDRMAAGEATWKTTQLYRAMNMMNPDSYFLRALLSDQLVRLNTQPRAAQELLDMLAICDEAAEEQCREVLKEALRKAPNGRDYILEAPLEGRYPILAAVALLEREEQDKLVNSLNAPLAAKPGLRKDMLTVDLILLMLEEKAPKDWVERCAPAVSGRVVYDIAAEIFIAQGGLGRVRQYNDIPMHYDFLLNNGARVRTCEPWYKFRYDENFKLAENTAEFLASLPIPIRNPGEIARFPVRVDVWDREKKTHQLKEVTAICYKGTVVDNEGKQMEAYLIRDEENYYTKLAYTYKSERNPTLCSWEEFSAFFGRAAEELRARLDEEDRKGNPQIWKPSIVHTHDSQAGCATLYHKLDLLQMLHRNASIDNMIAEQPVEPTHPDYARLSPLNVFSTHTLPNRHTAGIDWFANVILRQLCLPEEFVSLGQHLGRWGEPVGDVASMQIRTADAAQVVAFQHGLAVAPYDEWWMKAHNKKLRLTAVTNGDLRELTAREFRKIMKGLYPNVDVEHPAGFQVYETKRKARQEKVIQGVGFDPDRPVIFFSGRGTSEKAGRQRALCDENVIELLKMGFDVFFQLNIQDNGESRAIEYDLRGLQEEIRTQPDIEGRLLFVNHFTQNEQLELLALADILILDSDPQTEAAGKTEVNGQATACIIIGPPWPEGIIQAPRDMMDLDRPGRGSILVPDVKVDEKDYPKFQKYDGYDRGTNQKVAGAYMALYRKLFARLAPDGRMATFMKNLAPYQASAVPVSWVFDSRLTAAVQLRMYDRYLYEREEQQKLLQLAPPAPQPAPTPEVETAASSVLRPRAYAEAGRGPRPKLSDLERVALDIVTELAESQRVLTINELINEVRKWVIRATVQEIFEVLKNGWYIQRYLEENGLVFAVWNTPTDRYLAVLTPRQKDIVDQIRVLILDIDKNGILPAIEARRWRNFLSGLAPDKKTANLLAIVFTIEEDALRYKEAAANLLMDLEQHFRVNPGKPFTVTIEGPKGRAQVKRVRLTVRNFGREVRPGRPTAKMAAEISPKAAGWVMPEIPQEILDIPVEKYLAPLSTRLRRVLIRHGCLTVGDVVNIGLRYFKELRNYRETRNFGSVTLNELWDKMAQKGLWPPRSKKMVRTGHFEEVERTAASAMSSILRPRAYAEAGRGPRLAGGHNREEALAERIPFISPQNLFKIIDTSRIRSILYPACGTDMETVFNQFVIPIASIEEVHLVDSEEQPLLFPMENIISKVLYYLTRSGYEVDLIALNQQMVVTPNELKHHYTVTIPQKKMGDIYTIEAVHRENARRVHFYIHYGDYLALQIKKPLKNISDLTIVKYPGYKGRLSQNAEKMAFYSRILAHTRPGGYIYVTHAQPPFHWGFLKFMRTVATNCEPTEMMGTEELCGVRLAMDSTFEPRRNIFFSDGILAYGTYVLFEKQMKPRGYFEFMLKRYRIKKLREKKPPLRMDPNLSLEERQLASSVLRPRAFEEHNRFIYRKLSFLRRRQPLIYNKNRLSIARLARLSCWPNCPPVNSQKAPCP